MSEITVAASKFHRMFDYLSRIGLDAEAIGAAVNLSPARVAELPPGEGLPARQYSRLYNEAVVQAALLAGSRVAEKSATGGSHGGGARKVGAGRSACGQGQS